MMLSPNEAKDRIKGPVTGIPILFTQDGKINHAGMTEHIDYLIDSGIRVMLISIGISEYHLLSESDVRAIFTNIGETIADRALIIGSTGPWHTAKAAEFARFAEDSGIGALLIKAPDTVYRPYVPSDHDEAYTRHFEAVAGATQLGVLFHEKVIYARGSMRPWSLDLIRRVAAIDNVIGMKEESWDFNYSLEILEAIGDQIAIIDDAGKASFMLTNARGAPAYVSGISQYAPQIALQYWNALQSNDLLEARRIILDVEIPISRMMLQVGWVAFIKAAMEICGLPTSSLREPGVSLSNEQKEAVKSLLDRVGVISI